MINPSHPLFFRSILDTLSESNEIRVTVRKRGETIHLARQFGIKGTAIGKDYEEPVKKTLAIASRAMDLFFRAPKFDVALSFENPMSVAVSRMRMKRSILMLDNDLKYKIKGNVIQSIESRVKKSASNIVVPLVCKDTFGRHIKGSRLRFYDGYKEDIYIADHSPDKDFYSKVPFDEYYVIRPEAFASFYVKRSESLVEPLLERLSREGLKVVFLPRDRSDWNIEGGENIFIPNKPLDGLDLIYHSRGVLTGSGTMAREAAVMGRKAVSFFPSDALLTVDQDLVTRGHLVHSRNVDEIMDHIINGKERPPPNESGRVKEEVLGILLDLIGE